MIIKITTLKPQKTLTAVRNAFTLFSFIACYAITYGLFMTSTESTKVTFMNQTVINITNCTSGSELVDVVGWDDRNVYFYLSLGIGAVGLIFQGGIFHYFVREPVTKVKVALVKMGLTLLTVDDVTNITSNNFDIETVVETNNTDSNNTIHQSNNFINADLKVKRQSFNIVFSCQFN